MIYFRRKYFSSKKDENGNLRTGVEGLGNSLGVLGSLGTGLLIGNNAYKKHTDEILNKNSEYQAAHKNWKAATEAESALQESLEKAGDKTAIRKQIAAAEEHTGRMRTAMEHSKGKALDAGHHFEKGVGKGLLKGGAVAGLGLAATYGINKFYKNRAKKSS